jgi:Ca2+-binding RTX toxin-like protein
MIYRVLLLVFALCLSGTSWAASCSTGKIQYASGDLQFCDGTSWVSMKGAAVAGCTPAEAGKYLYASGVYVFCDGTNWYSMRGGVGASCAANQAGRLHFASSMMQFCDGTNWFNMAAGPAPYSCSPVTMPGTFFGDTLTGTNANDAIDGSSGNDTLNGLGGNDCLLGSSGNDVLLGGDGDDYFDAGSGDDILKGENGNDILRGSSGNDRLYGGPGSDTLTGGSGADLFIYTDPSEGVDTITDFTASLDRISFKGSAFGGLAAGSTVTLTSCAGIANCNQASTSPQFDFDTVAKALYYDANGSTNGTSDAIELFTINTVLHVSDITVF